MAQDAAGDYRRRHYNDPPVAEAIARLHFEQPITWDLTTPGLIFNALRSEYPREPRQQNLMQAQLQPGSDGNPQNLQLQAGPGKIVYLNEDESRLISVGPADISSHGMKPYEGWESLEERLFEGVDKILDVLPPEPRVTGLGVRYVNQVQIPEIEFAFEQYMTIGFAMPPGFPSHINGFLDRVESEYPDGRSKIAFTWATIEAPEGSTAFLLDLDLNWLGGPLTLKEARSELQSLKMKETAAFESLLQDKLRGLFNEDG